jgi:hypothetical protein
MDIVFKDLQSHLVKHYLIEELSQTISKKKSQIEKELEPVKVLSFKQMNKKVTTVSNLEIF